MRERGERDKVNYNRFCVRDRGSRWEEESDREWWDQRMTWRGWRKVNKMRNRMKENTNGE